MKIIKKGRDQIGWATQTLCTGKGNGEGGCGAELLVEEGDLYFTSSGHYDGSIDYFTPLTCPICGVKTDLEDVPSSVADRVIKVERKINNAK